tara:strand:+ start:297 stop:920 length:624 start_codon:yes stop_codon:yes gene_type:complete
MKNMKNSKLILTDCDGVLLDWSYRFFEFMDEKGYTLSAGYEKVYGVENCFDEVTDKTSARKLVTEFNESAWIGFLPALRDSVKYVKKLNEEHGYVFGVITSLSTNQYATALREENLVRIFGENVFDFIRCIETGADKDSELMEFKDSECWWIEDKVENAECGLKFGLNPILMRHAHNEIYAGSNMRNRNIRNARSWKEICNIITGEI